LCRNDLRHDELAGTKRGVCDAEWGRIQGEATGHPIQDIQRGHRVLMRRHIVGFSMRRIAVSLAAIVLGVSGTVATVASPASAGLCSWSWQDKDPGSSQVINPVSGFNGIAMRDG